MGVFNIISGAFGIVGAILSLITLLLTKSTRRQLQKYRFQVDITEQLTILKGCLDSSSEDPDPWDRKQIVSCQGAANKIRIMYSEKISSELSDSLESFINKLITLKRDPSNLQLLDEICDDLIPLIANVEKELTNDAF